jgi:hypothetical protein
MGIYYDFLRVFVKNILISYLKMLDSDNGNLCNEMRVKSQEILS